MSEQLHQADETASRDLPRTDWRKALPLIVLVGLAAYGNSFTKAFVFDDYYWIVENRHIGQLEPYLRTWPTRPAVGLSLYLNHQLGGLGVTGYHVFNLAVHLLAGLALFGLVRRTLLLDRWQGRFRDSAPWLALAVALVWLVHPLQTQAVTYIIQRCESLMGLFYLLTLYCAVRALGSPRKGWWYAGASLSALLGMNCKEVIVSAPVMILLYDWVFLRRPARKLLAERWPLYAGVASIWLFAAARAVLAPYDTSSAGFGFAGITPYEYLLTEAGVLLHYLRLAFWPHPLALDYTGWPIARSPGDALVPGIVVCVLLVGTVWALTRRSWLGFLGAWFFLILGPTSSIVPIGAVAFEHRMYLSLAALVVLAVMAASAVLNRLVARDLLSGQASRTVGAGVLSVVVVLLGGLTFARNEDYRSELTIWQDTLARRPDNYTAWRGLGDAYRNRGEWEKALEAMEQAERLAPGDPGSLINTGGLHHRLGHLDKARYHYEQALLRKPRDHRPECNLGLIALQEKKYREAERHFSRAVELEPNDARYRRYRAQTLALLGKPAEAKEEYEASLRLDPGWPDRVVRQGRHMLFAEGDRDGERLDEALVMIQQGCEAAPRPSPEMLDTLALAHARTGTFQKAIAAAREGVEAAEADGDERWLDVLRRRLRRYEQGKPVW